jgi:hypothetical protein
MGNWHISIEGVGIHHNHDPKDANVMANKFVQDLMAAGHTIYKASITHGGSDALGSVLYPWLPNEPKE